MEPQRDHHHGIQEDRVWEEEAEKILQESIGVERLDRVKLARATKESLEAKEVAGDIKKKRNQEEEGIEIGERKRKAKKKGESEAVGERGTQMRADQNVST